MGKNELSPEPLKVKVRQISMALFLGEIAKGNTSDTTKEYVSNIQRIVSLAQECYDRLDPDDPSIHYFGVLRHIGQPFMESLANLSFPVNSLMLDHHIGVIKQIATYYNKGIGSKKKDSAGVLGKVVKLFSNPIEDLIPEVNASNQKISDIFPDLLEAMKTQVNYANNLRFEGFGSKS